MTREALAACRGVLLTISVILLSGCGSGEHANPPARHTPITTLSAVPGSVPPPASGWRAVEQLPLKPETHGHRYQSPLSDVSATSTHSVFAVGSDGESLVHRTEEKYGSPLALRWNGDRWEKISAGLPREGSLGTVAAVSATKAWAMGQEWLRFVPGQERRWRTHLYQWDGRSWRSVLSDDMQTYQPDQLAASPDGNLWLSRSGGSPLRHWNGHTWSAQPLPCGGTCYVTQLDAHSATDVWAFAVTRSEHAAGYHWNGSSWKTVTLPPATGAVTATPSGDVWALGDICLHLVTPIPGKEPECTSHHAWAERWRAGRWQQTPLPASAAGRISSGDEPQDIAAGSYGNLIYPAGNKPSRYLYYDGGRWTMLNGAKRPADQACDLASIKNVPGTPAFVGVGDTIHMKACVEVDGTLG